MSSIEKTRRGLTRQPEASLNPEENVGRIYDLVGNHLPEPLAITNLFTIKSQVKDILRDDLPDVDYVARAYELSLANALPARNLGRS